MPISKFILNPMSQFLYQSRLLKGSGLENLRETIKCFRNHGEHSCQSSKSKPLVIDRFLLRSSARIFQKALELCSVHFKKINLGVRIDFFGELFNECHLSAIRSNGNRILGPTVLIRIR